MYWLPPYKIHWFEKHSQRDRNNKTKPTNQPTYEVFIIRVEYIHVMKNIIIIIIKMLVDFEREEKEEPEVERKDTIIISSF